MIPRYINPVSGRYGKILNFKEVSKVPYRYFYRVSVSIGCIHSIRASIIVTCALIDAFPVKFNSYSLFTAVVHISSGGLTLAADVILKNLYLLPNGVSGRYGKILSM